MKNVALIGLGMVAETHVLALRDATDLSLKGVLGRDPVKAQNFAKAASDVTGQSVEAYSNIVDLTNDPEIDFVVLATPPDARLAYVEALVQAGIPILMEKPIERSLPAARHIVELCEATQVPLGMVFQHRARAASIALKKAVEGGVLGQIVSAEIRIPWWRNQDYYDTPGRGTRSRDGGGVMITQAIHTLDLALWLLGPIDQVQALMHKTILHRMEAEDWASAILSFQNGCMGNMFATTAAFPGASETISLHGTMASAHLETGVLTLSHNDGRVEKAGEDATTGGGADPMDFTHGWHKSIIETFAKSLDTDATPIATGRDALMSHAVIDAMELSSSKGTWAKVQMS